jgi:spermidine/putrescine transport system permease protein
LGIILTHVIYTSPVAFFLLYLSHRNLNPEIEECARNLGASEHQIALQVALPQLRKACISAGIICALISWDEFIITWFVSGFHKTLPTLVYGMLGATLDPILFAVGTLITMISLLLVVTLALLMRDQIMLGLARR